MISKENIEVTKIITEKLSHDNINWALIGSSNLALQGVDVRAHDIDILTDKEGALRIGKLLKEFTKEEVGYKESEKFRSYFGKFIINGIDVEIMGDLLVVNPSGDIWDETTNFLDKKIYFQIDDTEIPIISLDQEYKAYSRQGKEKKAQKIAERITFQATNS
ncbi:hypothetical protein KKD37_00380 [Patescibacteria group bacterium]|nr:hypothetical protein [Patescibacteria group bacterium]